jgi:hypothetical protein
MQLRRPSGAACASETASDMAKLHKRTHQVPENKGFSILALSETNPSFSSSPLSICSSPVVVRGRWPSAIHAMAARMNRDGTERDISSGFCLCRAAARWMQNEKTNPLRNCCFDQTKPNDPWKCSTFRTSSGSPPARDARAALIRPSRFSRRSHRENRAGYLLSLSERRYLEWRTRSGKTNPLRASRAVVLGSVKDSNTKRSQSLRSAERSKTRKRTH